MKFINESPSYSFDDPLINFFPLNIKSLKSFRVSKYSQNKWPANNIFNLVFGKNTFEPTPVNKWIKVYSSKPWWDKHSGVLEFGNKLWIKLLWFGQ